MKRTLAILFTGPVLLAACGGASSAPPERPETTPTPPAVAYTTPADLSRAQLQSMTLALADFGPRYATFAPSSDVELTLIAERALQACDSDRESVALNKYGWSKGYTRSFEDPEETLASTFAVGTDVDVYSTASNAAIKLKYDFKALQEAQREHGCQGAWLENVSRFDAPGLGDESQGVQAHFNLSGVRGVLTAVSIRRDRLIATVYVWRLNSEDSTAELLDLARLVDERMLPVLTAPLS